MISLIMPPDSQVPKVNKMLGDEFGTASNIKNRVNRQSASRHAKPKPHSSPLASRLE